MTTTSLDELDFSLEITVVKGEDVISVEASNWKQAMSFAIEGEDVSDAKLRALDAAKIALELYAIEVREESKASLRGSLRNRS